MAEINVLVVDNGSDTIKAGYCIPERDPLLVRSCFAAAAGRVGASQRARLQRRDAARARR